MNTPLNILFILTPLLLIILVHFQRKLNSVFLCKELNALEKQFLYKLVGFINDIVALFTEGCVWMAITFIIVSKGRGDYLPLTIILIIMSLVSFISTSFYYSIKLNAVQTNFVLLISIGTLSVVSRALAVFFIATIMNYFFDLRLHVLDV
ncbi:hypothetical protein [Wolbachia endosymbiont of Trichogramma pretiosum]|uniref:hypothetical protein n=1 Tax=Wolbachia endosymbiont of Trichogramma pretiosum TaxID=125593 RepID=UPI000839914C|nr:hypothetical protein [Wolbachia endosymbiont of Trichogramma pretiosum]OCA06386.1 putative membrane protein [Wolbachia endosymbiont of Trichogramma pretiosum]